MEVADDLVRLASRRQPAPVRIPITDRCNQHCSWCPCRTEGQGTLSPARLTRKLEAAAARAEREDVLLSGAEPALHPRFFSMMRLLAARSVRTGFVTNGRIFSLPDWARKAGQVGVRFVVWRIPAPLSDLAVHSGDESATEQSLLGLDNLLALRALAIQAEIGVPNGTEDGVADTLRTLAARGVFRCRLVTQSPLSPAWSKAWSLLAVELRLSLSLPPSVSASAL